MLSAGFINQVMNRCDFRDSSYQLLKGFHLAVAHVDGAVISPESSGSK